MNGLEFNNQLKEAFEEAWFDINTKPTSTMFDDFTIAENLRAWEVFNGECMVGLRWALNVSTTYTVATNTLDQFALSEFEIKKLYKGYPINNELALKLIICKISETKVILYGHDVSTGDMVYGAVDLEKKELKSGTGQGYLKETLGNYHASMLVGYLQPNQQ